MGTLTGDPATYIKLPKTPEEQSVKKGVDTAKHVNFEARTVINENDKAKDAK